MLFSHLNYISIYSLQLFVYNEKMTKELLYCNVLFYLFQIDMHNRIHFLTVWAFEIDNNLALHQSPSFL